MAKLRIVHVYKDQHSLAFTEVCETLWHAFSDLGRDIDIGPKLSGSRRNIIVGANQLDMAIPGEIEYVIVQLEQLPGRWWNPIYQDILQNAAEVWDYDPANVEFLRKNHIKAKQLTLGYHESLDRIKPQKKRIDVLHYGSLNPRRRQVLGACRALGLNVQECFDVYGSDRDQLIAQAKIVLNMHFYEEQIFEQARVSYLLNNGVTVVSESSTYDPYFNVPFVRAPYQLLAETCKAAIEKGCDGKMAQQEFKNKHDMARILRETLS